MNKLQTNITDMSNGVQVLLTPIAAANANPILADKLAKLKIRNETIAKLSEAQQARQLRAKRDGREVAVGDLTDTSLLVAGSLVAYGRTHRHTEIASQMDLTRSDFGRLRRPQRVKLAESILAAARAVEAELVVFGTTPALLDELEAQAKAAGASIDAHRTTANASKTATGQLALEIEGLLAFLANEIDPIMAPLRKTDNALWMSYHYARQVMDRPGTRSSAAPTAATTTAEATTVTTVTPATAAVATATPTTEHRAA